MAKKRKRNEPSERVSAAPQEQTPAEPSPARPSRSVLLAVAAILGVLLGAYFLRPRAISRDPGLSVILISIDTLRADALSAYGGQATTRWIDRLANSGARFESAHAHNVVTFPSHSNILSGLYPLAHGVRDNTGFRFPQGTETLATRLKARGFRTGAFISAFVLDSRFGLDRGFDVYDDQTAGVDRQTPFVVPDRPATETVAHAMRWLDAEPGRQSFLFLHLYDPHFPYQPAEPFASRHKDQPYFGEVEAVDAALEPLLKPILEGSRSKDTLVIFTSDHGEGLGEHGELTHGIFTYETTLHVPLIVRIPGAGKTVVKEPARHIDIVPTVLDALGMTVPAELPGKSLLGLMSGGSAPDGFSSYFESLSSSLNQGWAPLHGVLDERFKYIDLPLPEVYDLVSDPRELKNLAATEPVRLDAMKAVLGRHRAEDRGVKRQGEDAATIERLRALGYVGAAQAAPTKDKYTAADDPKNLIEIDERNREVVTLFMQGKLTEAIAAARANLKQRPDMAGATLQLAYLLNVTGDLSGAVDAARKAVSLKPLDSEAVSLLGAYLTESGRPKEAIEVLEPYVKETAPDFDVLTALGLAYAATGQGARARDVFTKAQLTDPSNGMALVNLGTLDLMEGNRVAARAKLERALELDDAIAKAHNTLGVIAAQEGNMPEAIARWKRSVELNPRDYQTLFNLGTTMEKAGDVASARRYFEAYVLAAPPGLEARDLARTRDWLSKHPTR